MCVCARACVYENIIRRKEVESRRTGRGELFSKVFWLYLGAKVCGISPMNITNHSELVFAFTLWKERTL